MNERTMKLRLGAAVVLSIVIIIIFLSALGSREKFSISSYMIKIQLVDAPNVVEYTPIFRGPSASPDRGSGNARRPVRPASG